jgi:hypothetical protein
LNLHVYIAVEGLFAQIVVVNYVIRKKLEGHSHVLVLIEGSFEIHVVDVCATKLGSWGTDDTVPHIFCRDHVGCTCGEFAWIIGETAANSDSNSIWVVFLGWWSMTIRAYVTV